MDNEQLTKILSDSVAFTSNIDKELFPKMGVKRGLRNEDHSGVLAGLTRVGDVVGYERQEEGTLKPIPGKLYYRGLDVEELVKGIQSENRLGFEETVYLLLSGKLPTKEELAAVNSLLAQTMPLNHTATMNILSLKGKNIMNILARSVLELYTYDENPDDISPENLVRQSVNLIAKFPTIIAYAYQVLRHDQMGRSLHIRHPYEDRSVAENFLFMMKGRDKYTELDIKILDLALILHAEHGGGNNSTFSVRVTSSTETDTYSAIAAGIGSLKGPLHGGANIKVQGMLEDMKKNVSDWKSVDQIDNYLLKKPEEYAVVATLNLNGDYISDQLAAMVGGIGIAPGANINYHTGHAIFEATHGTAPDIVGKEKANPCSLLLSGVMMLDYMGWHDAGKLITDSLEKLFEAGWATSDLARFMEQGKPLTTAQFSQKVIENL